MLFFFVVKLISFLNFLNVLGVFDFLVLFVLLDFSSFGKLVILLVGENSDVELLIGDIIV